MNLEEELDQRDEALRHLNIGYAKQRIGYPVSRMTALIILHRARYECTTIEEPYRRLSERWLRDRGLKRMHKLPWPLDGKLPV